MIDMKSECGITIASASTAGSVTPRHYFARWALAWILTFPLVALAQSVPIEAGAFTSYMAERLKTLAHEDTEIHVQVTIMRPLALKLTSQSGMSVEANLTDLQAHCVALNGRCGEAAEQLAQSAIQAFGESARPVQRDMLRALVRPAAWVSELSEIHKQRGIAPLLAKPYVGELWIVVGLNRNALIGLATTETLSKLSLDENAAFELALKNTREAKLPVLNRAVPLRGTRFEMVSEDNYESSRFLMHGEWAEVARVRGGDLIVSVPASNTIIFGAVRNPAQIDDLRAVAVQEARKAPRAVSVQLFRWRANGWELVGSPAEAQARVQLSGPADK
jgi:hypothetical protein